MSIDPALLSQHNGPPVAASIPEIPFWQDDSCQSLTADPGTIFDPFATRESFEADQMRLDAMMKEAAEQDPTKKFGSQTYRPPDLDWDPLAFSSVANFIEADPARRRSQSQPPSYDRTEPLIQPDVMMPVMAEALVCRPSMARSATAVPRRFHPYAGNRNHHQRSYTSHPAIRNPDEMSKNTNWQLRPRRLDGEVVGFPSGPHRPQPHPLPSNVLPSQSLEIIGDVPYSFKLYHDQTSLALGLQTQLKSLQEHCSAMQQFLSIAFSPGGDCSAGHQARSEVEQKRLLARATNREVEDLDGELQQLAIHDAEFREVSAPATGRELQTLSHDAMNNLLDAFEVYHKKDMFLWEKKEIWLKFVGASRKLMYKVLD